METKANVVNGVDVGAVQKTVETLKGKPELGRSRFHIKNRWIKGGHNQTTITDFFAAGQDIAHEHPFTLDADEPAVLAGTDKGPNPVEHLLNALAGCVTTSMVYHAAIRGIVIEELQSELEGDIDLRGFLGIEKNVRNGYQNIRVKFKVKSDAKPDKLKALCKFSPTYDVITHGTSVDIEVEKM
ncbi:MAG: OsmC family protein [Nitrospirota bacterium]|jgi:uncharacterized OsmC-like protein